MTHTLTQQEADVSEWISKKGWCDALRISTGTVDGYMARHWTKGVEYTVIGQTTYIHKARADAWIGRQGYDPAGEDLRSQSGTEGAGPTARSSRATRTARLISPVR